MPHPSTSSAYGIWSLNEVRDAVRGENWPVVPPLTLDLANATYDNVSFSIAAQETNPLGLCFNNDGSKMYVVGQASDSVHQYSLATAFDLSTASYDSVSLNVGSQDQAPDGIRFNNDGTKMYILGSSNDNFYQYVLSTPFDISTASYDTFILGINSPDGIAFNDDGSTLFSIGDSFDTIQPYNLATPFDFNGGRTLGTSFTLTNPASDFLFNPAGTKLYVLSGALDIVEQYTLSTPFDVTTATDDLLSFDVGNEAPSPTAFNTNNDLSKMYVVDYNSDTIFQYSTGL